MTTTTPPRTDSSRRPNQWATGLALFAGTMMIVLGVNQVLAGIAGIADDEVYVPVGGYVYGFDLTTWGWIHLVVGAIAALAGVFIFRGQDWARGVGIWLAFLSIIANFVFLPYYPIWSVLLIALGVAAIWGLAQSAGRDAVGNLR